MKQLIVTFTSVDNTIAIEVQSNTECADKFSTVEIIGMLEMYKYSLINEYKSISNFVGEN